MCAALCSRWLGRGDVALSHGRRPRTGARCRASSRVQLGGARAASGPHAGRVAPPLVDVTLAVWVGCCARRSEWHRRRRRESSGGVAREEHDARDAPPRKCAALCSRWLGKGGCVTRSHGRRPRAASTMQSELARAAGRRACGVGSPCRARGSSSCRRDACRVGWVLCTPQSMASATTARELWRPRSRRTRRSRSSASTVRGSVLAVAVGKGDVWRGPTAGGRARAHDAERARACSWAARVRRRVPMPGAWLLLLSA